MQIKSTFSQPTANSAGHKEVPSLVSVEGETSTVSSGITQEFHNFVADVEDLVSKTTSLTGEDLTRAKLNLSARIAAAKQSMQAISGAVTQSARKTVTATNDYVHEQPWQAIGIGAAAGLLFGFLLGRRK